MREVALTDRHKTDKGRIYALGIAVFAAAILALVMATPSEAARRPTIDNIDACTGRSNDKGCGGLICYCCYTEGPEKGCWICDSNFHNCSWDPARMKGTGVTRPGTGVVPPKVYEPPAPSGGMKPPGGTVTPGLTR